ncbi:MAG TPA: zinc ribbon domain-containing protein [Methanomassiliicoccales archaeon]|nr:zinc ribbon domain-containing protein [Methanomassiliicoccales archaeon]
MADTSARSPNFLQKMRGTRQGIILGILVTFVVSYFTLTYLGIGFCLAPAIVALMMYFVPRWFGLLSRRKLAIFGVIFLLVIGVMVGATAYFSETALQSNPVSADNVLTNGIVTPFKDTSATQFNYSVVLTGGNSTPTLLLHIGSWSISEVIFKMTDNFTGPGPNQVTYNLSLTLPAREVYAYFYEYVDPSGATHSTPVAFGPITANDGQILTQALSSNLLNTFYLVGLLFFLLLVLTWWMDSSRKKFEARQAGPPQKPTKGGKQEKFVCSECGAEVPADATQCARCGEKFDEGEKPKLAESTAPKAADEFVCSECGKTVKATDKKCWNCGKEFEN